jgi:hypothetical protein
MPSAKPQAGCSRKHNVVIQVALAGMPIDANLSQARHCRSGSRWLKATDADYLEVRKNLNVGTDENERLPRLRQVIAGAGQNASQLLARRAGVHVDLHAHRHFNDLWSFPSHLGLPRDGANTRTDHECKTVARLTQGPHRRTSLSIAI